MRALPFSSSPDAEVVKVAQRLLQSQYDGAPKVLDLFGGGGTIPYEAALLGADVSSMDYNPLSVFIQKSNLVFSQEALSQTNRVELVRLVKDSGKRVLEEVRTRTEDLFPLRSSETGSGTFAYFWSYRLPCRSCGLDFLLTRRPWLSRKGGKRTALKVVNSGQHQSVTIVNGSELDDGSAGSVWPGRNGTAFCPRCQAEHKNPSIRNCAEHLLAMGVVLRRGKAFRGPTKNAIPSVKYLSSREARLLKRLGLRLPETRLPRWSGIVNPALYGIETHSDFLNRRQRLVLLELIGVLRQESELLHAKYSAEIARCVVAALSALVDQLVDWNCRLSMWISQNEQVGRAFCGPGVPMLWDYVETDPLLNGPANLWDKLDRIVAGVGATPRFAKNPTVQKACAQRLPFPQDTFDAVITDPPYYDNVYYNVLADFFYVWKRPVLESFCPELFRADRCEEGAELVASRFRHGDHETAHKWYCTQITQCLQEVRRVLKPKGILSFVFSHSSLWGWEAIIRGFRQSGLTLTSAEPMSIERRQRPRAMTSEAVNTCVVLVARKSAVHPITVDITALVESVEGHARSMGPRLKACGWHERDIGMAVFSQGVVALAGAANVSGVNSDVESLERISNAVHSKFPAFKLQTRQSL